MNAFKKTSIRVAVAAIIIGLIISVSAFAALGFDPQKLNTVETALKTHVVDEPFERIRIEGADCDVRLAASEDGACSVTAPEGEGLKCAVSVEDGVLTVRREDARKWYECIGISFGTETLTVLLPRTEYAALWVQTASGNIEVPDSFSFAEAEITSASGDVRFSARVSGALRVETVSGRLNLERVRAAEISAASVSGDAVLSRVETEGALSLRTVSGDDALSDVRCGNLNSVSTSGDQRFSGVIASGALQVSSTSGEIALNDCDANALELESTSGDVRGDLRSDKIFSVETRSGDVRVPASTSGGICRVRTVSGDVHLALAGG